MKPYYDETRYWTKTITHALSTTCGQPILDRVKRLEEALKDISEMECDADHPDGCECCLVESGAVYIAQQALETGGGK